MQVKVHRSVAWHWSLNMCPYMAIAASPVFPFVGFLCITLWSLNISSGKNLMAPTVTEMFQISLQYKPSKNFQKDLD